MIITRRSLLISHWSLPTLNLSLSSTSYQISHLLLLLLLLVFISWQCNRVIFTCQPVKVLGFFLFQWLFQVSTVCVRAMSLMSMRDARPFKQAFLKNLLLGLKSGGVSSRDMSFEERKDAIRRAADAALASARGGAPCWSRSLAAAALARRPGKNSASCRLLDAPPRSPVKWRPGKAMISKKILRRSLRWRPRSAAASGGALATAMVRKRTRVLKAIVPGGEVLDECSLLGETLDYAMSLKAQVDVMQLLVRALQSTPKPYSCSTEEAAVGRD